MFGMGEQQKKMLEALEQRNESIDAFEQSFGARIDAFDQSFGASMESVGKSFGGGMNKLDEHADDLLKLITMLEFLKQIFDEKLRKRAYLQRKMSRFIKKI